MMRQHCRLCVVTCRAYCHPFTSLRFFRTLIRKLVSSLWGSREADKMARIPLSIPLSILLVAGLMAVRTPCAQAFVPAASPSLRARKSSFGDSWSCRLPHASFAILSPLPARTLSTHSKSRSSKLQATNFILNLHSF